MRVVDAVEVLAAKDIADVEREWDKYDVAGNAYITFKITKDTPILVEGRYDAKGMKMWTLEYGSGSKMDMTNPHLKEYKRSEVYNSNRGKAGQSLSGTEIRTRPKSESDEDGYEDIDAPNHKRHQGSGLGFGSKWTIGLNAEWLRGKNKERGGKPNAIDPIEPHHIIKDIVPRKNTVHKQEFRANILKAISDELRGVMKD